MLISNQLMNKKYKKTLHYSLVSIVASSVGRARDSFFLFGTEYASPFISLFYTKTKMQQQ